MSYELPPIRCVTCNKVLANKWQDYQDMIAEGVPIETALNRIGLERPCCRLRMRNPFKVVELHPQTQSDLDMMITGTERLSLKPSTKASTGSALAAVTSAESSGMMVDDDDDDIMLPDIPSVDTSKVPGTVRSYRAW